MGGTRAVVARPALTAGTVPTRVTTQFTASGNNSMVVAAPPGMTTGDWIVAVSEYTSGVTSAPSPPTGWSLVSDMSFSGTSRMSVFAKQYDGVETSWTFVQDTPTNRVVGLFVVRGAASVASWVVGTVGRRVDQAATLTTTAAGITVPAGTLVLTCASERTTATGDTISVSGATLWDYSFTAGIESCGAAYRQCPTAETTPSVVLTYNNAQTSNGLAVQVGIPGV